MEKKLTERIELNQLTRIEGMRRPEDIAVAPNGTIWTTDGRYAAAEIENGDVRRLGKAGGVPNGINFLPDGRLLIANLDSCIQVLDTNTGEVSPYITHAGDQQLLHINYVLADANGYVWGTESTRHPDPHPDIDAHEYPDWLGTSDGNVFVYRPDGTSEVLIEGIPFANGLCLSPDGRYLFIAETFSGKVIKAEILPGGNLGSIEDYVVFQPDGLEEVAGGVPGPDGIGFDSEGNLWVCLWNRNTVAVVRPDKQIDYVLTDPTGDVVNLPTNVTWGGPDRTTLYIGSVGVDYVLKTKVNVPGIPQPWEIVTPAGEI
ncbi:SMP-30/gluconolactonase/LRE family protein [Neobacillus niacini]|uniref:SMP-30/gluconolactonase/LRE family protein n=1 Tax=Neobacillus niacini TaxID=86668 RepID=UPI002FFD89F3